tara:strand:+ start:416 stop:976 length:561 start_codon:yes stop_codon:yes gene_type:complete
MPDYSKSIIYTIRSKDNIYVGSTINFRSRKKGHKNSITNENQVSYNLNLYKTIRENGGEWEMKPYSIFPCNSKMELSIEEERVRRLLNADLNMISCGTGINYSELGREKYNKIYYSNEKYIEYRAKYYEQHRENINERQKQYYHINKKKINQKLLRKVTCECGCIVAKNALIRHKKTQKHLKLLKT